jgi:hypothetical protein
MAAQVSVLGRPGRQVADELGGLFGGLNRPENRLLDPEQRERQLILGELEYFLAPLVLKLTPCREQLAQLRIIRRDLTRELPPSLQVVAASRRAQEEAAGEGADLLTRSIIEPLELPALLSDRDSAALGTHPDFAQPLLSCAQRLGRHPFAGLVEVTLSTCQRRLSLGQLFPEPTLALSLGLEPRQCIRVLSPARLGQRLDRLAQQLPCPGSPDVSGASRSSALASLTSVSATGRSTSPASIRLICAAERPLRRANPRIERPAPTRASLVTSAIVWSWSCIATQV